MQLPSISDEQQDIVDCVIGGHNVRVDAVAGSGKTTTSLYIAQSCPHKNILLLTYNAKLKTETRHKAMCLNLDSLEVHSYHAFCVKYLDRRGYTDSGILRFLEQKTPTKCDPFPYDIVIIDEAQDMNKIYFRMVMYILKQCRVPPQLVVMGDRKQSIYAFNKADARFLVLCSHIFPSPYTWKEKTLSVSYRLTLPMATFLNRCCTGTLPIRSIKHGAPVQYVVCCTFGTKPCDMIESYLDKGFQYDDIFVLAATLKSQQSPVRVLANRLSARKIPIYVPTHDDEKLDENVLKNKIVFSTFHQVKGLERKVVLVFDFSANYFHYYAKQEDPYSIPNTLYVATTRAQEHLVLFHDDGSAYCPFLDVPRLVSSCRVLYHTRKTVPEMFVHRDTSESIKEFSIDDIVRYIPVEMIEECLQCLHIVTESSKKKRISFILTTKNLEHGLAEYVGDITCSAIPSFFEYLSTQKMTLYTHLQALRSSKKLLGRRREDDVGSIYKTFEKEKSIESLLRLSTEWVIQKTGYHFKKFQIQSYTWLTQDHLDEAVRRLETRIDNNNSHHLQFEKQVYCPFADVGLKGFCSIFHVEKKEQWILKLVSEVKPHHLVHAGIFQLIGQKIYGTTTSTFLYNVVDDCKYTISLASPESFEHVLSKIIDVKRNGMEEKSDQEFVRACTS